jgi:hypothetical protein
MGVTFMDPSLDRRKGERRKNNRREKDRRMQASDRGLKQDRRKSERRKKIAWFFGR